MREERGGGRLRKAELNFPSLSLLPFRLRSKQERGSRIQKMKYSEGRYAVANKEEDSPSKGSKKSER